MARIEKGIVADEKVELKTYSSIEHDNIKKISSIVLHRTDSTSANGTLSAYTNGKKSGAHFLIDKSGPIYQTASMLACGRVVATLPN